ncbi:MAG: hypothetical protein ACLFQV_04585 [Vulcanimicrobiota bacterium]
MNEIHWKRKFELIKAEPELYKFHPFKILVDGRIFFEEAFLKLILDEFMEAKKSLYSCRARFLYQCNNLGYQEKIKLFIVSWLLDNKAEQSLFAREATVEIWNNLGHRLFLFKQMDTLKTLSANLAPPELYNPVYENFYELDSDLEIDPIDYLTLFNLLTYIFIINKSSIIHSNKIVAFIDYVERFHRLFKQKFSEQKDISYFNGIMDLYDSKLGILFNIIKTHHKDKETAYKIIKDFIGSYIKITSEAQCELATMENILWIITFKDLSLEEKNFKYEEEKPENSNKNIWWLYSNIK